jgi:hypothetical protein
VNDLRPGTVRSSSHGFPDSKGHGIAFASLRWQAVFVSPLPERSMLMTLAAEKEFQHIGETCGCADHDHDLVHDLSKRLDALWRYDQYIANAEGKPALQTLWRDLKRQEIDNIRRVKETITAEIRAGCF